MWNIFKRAPEPIVRYRYIDWDKVKTVADIVSILKVLPSARIRALEEAWNKDGVREFLEDDVWIRTDNGDRLE